MLIKDMAFVREMTNLTGTFWHGKLKGMLQVQRSPGEGRQGLMIQHKFQAIPWTGIIMEDV